MLRVPVDTVRVPDCAEPPIAEYELRVPLALLKAGAPAPPPLFTVD